LAKETDINSAPWARVAREGKFIVQQSINISAANFDFSQFQNSKTKMDL